MPGPLATREGAGRHALTRSWLTARPGPRWLVPGCVGTSAPRRARRSRSTSSSGLTSRPA
eukprot:5455346-Lingulodinium_polyedra.AAC.1